MDTSKFKPKTIYVTYIAATPEAVWQALTSPAFTRQYFAGFAIDVEPRSGGAFRMLYPDGRVHIQGEVVEWTPPSRFACTWIVEGMPETAGLPASLVTYEIEQAGEAVRLTMTESHQWDVPDAILSGGRAGWPAILSSLKSVLETGRPLSIKMAPPQEMLDALKALKR
ncbi:MAG TPA: SRPBCC family protein [Pseudolabrys sp.]|nr:SRPBCC family protein [Pseudolabrys sp.]